MTDEIVIVSAAGTYGRGVFQRRIRSDTRA